MLAGDPGAPRPEDIVEDWDFNAPPPTPGLAFGDPEAVWYFLPFRARGDFRTRLYAQPETPRAQLERTLVVAYPEGTDLDAVMAELLADPNIEAVNKPIPMRFSSPVASAKTPLPGPMNQPAENYGLTAMNLPAAWARAGGYGLVGMPDAGLATNHPELRPFTPNGTFTRGNFLPAYAVDLGRWPNDLDYNVDELEPELVVNPDPSCPTDPNGYAPVDFAGHGTHVASMVAANAYDGNAVRGTCKHCGIGMWRVTYASCTQDYGITPALNVDAAAASIVHLSDIGMQVITQSFGFDDYLPNVCGTYPATPFCLAMSYATPRQIVLVAASGNDRIWLNFPARDTRVVAVGGFDQQLTLWNEDKDPPPNHKDDCPDKGYNDQCGSNYTTGPGEGKQELVAAARQVYGAVYPGQNWNVLFGCGDGIGPGAANDGYGLCTGTSMSSPLIAGVFGLLRSINPLVRAGHPDTPQALGVRNVLVTTTMQAQANQSWSATLGHGVPDAAAAVRRMLGKVAGVTVRNRATPLFGFYSSGSKDHGYTTSPNTAIAFLINSVANAVTSGPTVPGYPAFPEDPYLTPDDVPRANVFVLTTEYKTRPHLPDLTPLYLLERSRLYPPGCNPLVPTCANNRDYLLATGQGEVEALHAAGYGYRGIQGYVYQRCTPEPACVPTGAQKLWRKCKTADDDCAVFLENQRAAFEANGYTTVFPASFNSHIGYAYPNIDSDGDGLVDGFEHVTGTSHVHADSDGDGVPDGIEFPLAGVSTSDPCDGPLAWRCPGDVIFEHDFEL